LDSRVTGEHDGKLGLGHREGVQHGSGGSGHPRLGYAPVGAGLD
jgi:hypothetical protein